jgi:holo-ACP synthase/triphosphoribosyl-dephospho-CoA synthase
MKTVMEAIVKKILEAKDRRALRRASIANKGLPSISFNLNIPGYPKSSDLFNAFFQSCLTDLKRHLLSHRLHIVDDEEFVHVDEAGDFFIVPLQLVEHEIDQVKEITEEFEQLHPLGRLLDVDVTDCFGNPVSSGKSKLCFFCNEFSAIECMRNQTHTYEEMRNKIDVEISVFFSQRKKDRVVKDLSAMALKALLHEVSLSPKPGLVDRLSNGSHTDMDFATFINSSAVLSVYFKDIAEFAYSFNENNIKKALPTLRNIGMQMEEDMFRETLGVNTHKGAIFLLGFSLFACSYLIARDRFTYGSFVGLIKELNGNLVEKELGKRLYSKNKTHGEVCFEKYGSKGKGIRGEIQAGLPSVFEHAIPVLDSHLGKLDHLTDKVLNKGLTHALLALIAYNDDSNILFRKGEEVLARLKTLAKNAFDAYGSNDYQSEYQTLIDYCEEKHISPGGSADLLAVSLFIYTAKDRYEVL